MTLPFPSPQFDDAVASVCHGTATEAEMRALSELLRGNAGARDEYLLQVELHTRLASEPDLFAERAEVAARRRNIPSFGGEQSWRSPETPPPPGQSRST